MSDSENPANSKDQIALYILTERLNELRDRHEKTEDRNLDLFTQLTNNQTTLSERLSVVETNSEHVSVALIKLQKDSSIQTKLLSGILVATVGAIVTLIAKSILGI